MMKTSAVLCLLAAVARAQVDISSESNDLTASRRQTVSLFDVQSTMQSTAAAAAQRIATLEAQVSSLMSQDSPIALTVTGIASDMTARTTGLLQSSVENSMGVASVTDRMDAVDNTLQSTMDSITSTMAAQQAANAAQASTIAATNAAQATALESQITATLGTLSTSLNRSVTGQISTITRSMNALDVRVNRSVTSAIGGLAADLATKADKHTHVWGGTCSSRAHGGWRDFCLNVVQVDTARPRFQKQSNTRFRSLVTGIYDLFFHRMYTACNWAHMHWMVNGSEKINTHEHVPHGSWQIANIRMAWVIPAGQQFWAAAYSTCGWTTWHENVYSKIMVVYHDKAA